MTQRLAKRITHTLVAKRYWLLGIAVLIVGTSICFQSEVDFDRSVENMLAKGDPLLGPFRRLKRTFGGNEIVLAVYRDEELLGSDREGIRRLAQVSQRLEQVPGVRSVLSLERPMGEMIVDPDSPLAERTRKLFEGYTHSASGKIAVVVCMLLPESETDASRRETIDALRAIMEQLPDGLPSGTVTGEPVMLVDGFRFVEQDGIRLGRWSSLLLGLTILICFRSPRWVLICIAVVQVARMLTNFILASMGLRLSMVSSMLTAVVTVVGVATVVHVTVRFREAQRAGHGRVASLVWTGGILVVPIFWACVTDAVGFASLMSASVGPVQDFGLMMAIGCLAVLISVPLLVPALAAMGSPRQSLPASWGEDWLCERLGRFANWVGQHPKTVGVLATLLVVLAVAGVSHLEVETDFTRNFQRDSEIVQGYKFVEDNLGGAGVGDILIPAPERLSWKYLRQVRKLEQQIEQEANSSGNLAGVTKVLSLADAVVAGAPQLENSTSSLGSELITRAGLAAMRTRIPSFYDALFGQDPDNDQHYVRIMLRAREQQAAQQKRDLIERLETVSRQKFPEADVTGFFVLLTNLIDSIVRDQWRTFAVAIAGIGLTMLIAFRHVGLAIAALIPNALPILVVSGVMGWIGWLGWFDFKINMGSAMIAAVSLGLSIDSSIHYIFAFQRARRQGRTISAAIEAAHRTVGLSMVFATLALIVGFTVLATSEFTPTVYFGCLVSLAMIGGLLGNLVVLPLLLRMVVRD